MITELYTFTPGSYVVADEWNANFRVLYNTNLAHLEAINDAWATVAFPTSDLTSVFNAVRSQPNSFAIPGDTVTIAPECEYYKTLSGEETLDIDIPNGFSAESRIMIKIPDDRAIETPPYVIINYTGQIIEDSGDLESYKAGTYSIFIFESNGLAQIKVLKAIGA